MKSFFLLTFLMLGFSLSGNAQQAVYFTDYPTISPDGQTIVFTYEGDLWRVAASGGMAARITAMEGTENRPSISPDGKWLAFTSSQYGNSDIFVMPLNGGNIRQLTYHDGGDYMESWSWDSQSLYFTSGRYNRISTYKVPLAGGTPERLFEHYFNNIHNAFEHPVTGEIFFNETWESWNFEHRKGYKGPYNPDIKSYHPAKAEYKQYTTYEGKDFDVTIDKNGRTYFLSDEFNGQYNLYEWANGKKKRLTKFKTSVRRPCVAAGGSKLVFQKDYQLFLYDTKSGKTKQVSVQLPQNRVLEKTKQYNVKGKITGFDVSEDGKKLSFISRGELFVSDIEGKFVKHIPTKVDGRVAEVHWINSDSMLFSQTVMGYQNWFMISAKAGKNAKQLTKDQQNNRSLAFNSDMTKAVYLSGRNEVRQLDLETMQSETLLRDELWGFYNDQPRYSPDDRYIAFTAYRNFERDIMLYDLEKKQKINLTNTGVTEVNPFWSPDGKYLYFNSNQTKPSYPYGMQDAKIYRVALQKIDDPYRSDQLDKLFADEKEDEEKKDSVVVEIALEGIMERVERVGPRFGTQSGPYVYQKDNKTTILYSSNHDEGNNNLWQTVIEPFEKTKTEKIKGATTGSVGVEEEKGKHYVLIRGNINKLNLGGKKVEKIDISHSFEKQFQAEFEQMFDETWANLEENFYNETFHGVDWRAMREQYRAFLPYITRRGDLRRLLNDMLGELNTSHFGFYSNGDEEDIYYGTRTLATGIDFDGYTVKRIIKDTPADHPDKDIKAGDVLFAVNGEKVDPAKNREMYFAKAGQEEEISLTFQRNGKMHEVKLHPTISGQVRNARYDEWVDACQQRVDEKSNKKIAYVHMKNMGGGELNNFMKEMVSEANTRDGLILDLRYNTGGNVHDDVLQFLSQTPYLKWKYREGKASPQPTFAPAAKPIVLLINEQSLSDAEMTAAGFKELKLGTVMGTGTYRWIIFTSGKGLVDGSFYRLPSWGCYTLDGKNLEKTGVEPDIYVKNNMQHRLKGEDPQLDRAIQEIMKQLK
ncbi:MAG: S41 family peptidase [Saprospiraceae bacterium]|nr:S41 family peptidase [Saprospiraceae bacterium]